MEELISKLKVQIIEQLNLEDLSPEDIDADAPLFDSEIGLDSIDALEIIVLLEREYGIKINSQEEGKKVFHSVRSIAEYILQKQQ
ncbi:MAG: phosphopantetheine-binding protein [Saprospiraceae bacterium]